MSARLRRMRLRIMHWAWDVRPEWTWFVSDRLIARPLCLLVGHEPICNHHHRPEQDHCVFCMKPMPGKAHR